MQRNYVLHTNIQSKDCINRPWLHPTFDSLLIRSFPRPTNYDPDWYTDGRCNMYPAPENLDHKMYRPYLYLRQKRNSYKQQRWLQVYLTLGQTILDRNAVLQT